MMLLPSRIISSFIGIITLGKVGILLESGCIVCCWFAEFGAEPLFPRFARTLFTLSSGDYATTFAFHTVHMLEP